MIVVQLHWAAKWRDVDPCWKIIAPLPLVKPDVAVIWEVVCTARLAPAARRTLMHATLPIAVAMCKGVSPFASWPSMYLDGKVYLSDHGNVSHRWCCRTCSAHVCCAARAGCKGSCNQIDRRDVLEHKSVHQSKAVAADEHSTKHLVPRRLLNMVALAS